MYPTSFRSPVLLGAGMTALLSAPAHAQDIAAAATILLFALTDDVVDGSVSEATFRRAMIWISLSRLAGTLLAQALLVPAALVIAWAAGWL